MSGNEWWRPELFALRWPTLQKRAAIMAALRRWFDRQGFIEVDTPALQVSPGMEPHIMALSTEVKEPLGGSQRLYLHTSPEFAMKKLLVAGVRELYQIAHVWRDGERTVTHSPEFTMLEWYRAGADYRRLMEDCSALMAACAKAAGAAELARGDRRCNPFAEPKRLTVADAFTQYSGIDLRATTPDPLNPSRDLLAEQVRAKDIFVSDNDSWEDVFFRVMMERIEPHLGDEVPLILCDYPVSMAALSRRSPQDPRVAERFELSACGVELANGFSELTDAAEQRRRFTADMALKQKLYGVAYPIDEDFLAALDHGLPDCAGIALGVDRLVMLITGAETLDQALWAPVRSPAE
jgi:elongation factor P--(R)-beta-lysine ligase